MAFKEGKVVDSFSVKGKGGKKIQVTFRYPKKSDLKACLKMVNFVRREAECLGQRRIETLASEKKWLKKQLADMRKKKAVVVLVEAEGELVGDASIQPYQYDTAAHIGTFGIMLKEEFTGIGVGTRLGKRILELAKKETTYKIIESGHFSTNRRSAKLHKRLGFKKCGLLPNGSLLKGGGYDGTVWLYKQIKKL